MDLEREKLLNSLLLEAFARSPGERRAFIEQACGDDESLLSEAVQYLESDDLGDFLESPALADMSQPLSLESSKLVTLAVGEREASPKKVESLEKAESLEAGRQLGQYEILAHVGAGGMGQVYRARDTELRREVALKVLQPSLTRDEMAMSRFRREARLLASVNHPHIATIHGFVESEDICFLVMELVEGDNLAKHLDAGPLPLPRALQVNLQIARALQAAHKRGVIHRDLKPANVMVSPDGWVKVLDFGLAKALGAGATEAEPKGLPRSLAESRLVTMDETITDQLMGTAPYMSPEQVRQERLGQRSDVWAFGCVLFETLTGRRPFEGGSRLEVLGRILHGEPAWDQLAPDLPSPVRQLLKRCLEKDPEDRVQSIAEARAEIEALLDASMSSAMAAWSPSRGHQSGPQEAASSQLGLSPSTLGYLDSLDAYTIVERIAVGGQGELYRAWDRERKRDVAIKVLRPESLNDPEARSKLRQEAQALSWLRHPNIANVYDFGTTQDSNTSNSTSNSSTGEDVVALEGEGAGAVDFLVTEYIAGSTLASRLADGALPSGAVIRLGLQVAAALSEAHEQGILHRDLKTSNVMVTPDGQAKLIDFGLAGPSVLAEQKSLASGVQRLHDAQGPLVYRAPEIVGGESGNESSDIYSLGVVLYKMATGVRPFDGDTVEDLSEAILHQMPESPRQLQPSLSEDLAALILRCLEKDPAARFASAGELAGALEAMMPATAPLSGWMESAQHPAKSQSAGWLASGAPRFSRRTMIVTAVLAVVVAGLLFYGSRWLGGESPLASVDSVVVMPTRLLDEGERPYLADAIANAMSAHLSRVPDLEAKLPPSSFDIERLGGDLSKVADAYGAQAMVLSTASVRRGRRVLELQLVDASSRTLLWSESASDDGSTYSDLALDAADQLVQAMRPGQQVVAEVQANPEVEQFLLQGRYYSNSYRNRGREGDKERALACFEQALALDPTRADAAGEVAMLHTASLDLGVSVLEVLPEVRSWADRALEIDAKCSKAWAALGMVEGGRQTDSYRRKLEYLLKAATFGPRDGYAATRLSQPLAAISFTLALASSEQASSVEPLVLTSQIFEGICLGPLGQRSEALARVDNALGIEPGMPFGLIFRGLLLSVSDQEEVALALISEQLEPLVADGKLHPSWVGLAGDLATFARASRAGDTAAADTLATRLVATARGEIPFPRWEMATVEVAAQLAKWGRSEEALDVLELRGEQDIFQPYDYLLFSPELASIRDDPRYQEVLEQSRLRFVEILAILEEAQVKGELPGYLERPLADLLRRIRGLRQAA